MLLDIAPVGIKIKLVVNLLTMSRIFPLIVLESIEFLSRKRNTEIGFLLPRVFGFSRHCNVQPIEYEIIGEGSQISTNQKRERTVSWLLIGRNLRPFPENFVLY